MVSTHFFTSVGHFYPVSILYSGQIMALNIFQICIVIFYYCTFIHAYPLSWNAFSWSQSPPRVQSNLSFPFKTSSESSNQI